MEQLEQRVELNKQPDYEQALFDCQRFIFIPFYRIYLPKKIFIK